MPPRHSHPACLTDEELLKRCAVRRGKSGGPGGQNRNKVETLIELTDKPTGLSAHAGERRSQEENKRVALRRLRVRLAEEHRTPLARASMRARGKSVQDFLMTLDATSGRTGQASAEISDTWKARVRGDGTFAINVRHHDFPALLAEALDVIESEGGEMKSAAERLGITRSQLAKFVVKR